MQILLLFGLFTLATCQALSVPHIPLQTPLLNNIPRSPLLEEILDVVWDDYKNLFNKTYNEHEESLRRHIVLNRVFSIVRSNFQSLTTYTLGLNKYSDLSHDEYMKYLNGFRISNSSGVDPQPFFPHLNATKLPDKVDWRDQGLVTPIKDQGLCGSCWAFSSTGALEGQTKKRTGNLTSLSEQNLVDCVSANSGCDGGWMDPAFETVVKEKGIDTEASYPYVGIQDSCFFNSFTVGATCRGYVDIPSGDEIALKQAVATVGPISVAINAEAEEFQSYKSGIYDQPDCLGDINFLTHAVLVVGYGTENDTDYWLVKNSWGPTWGMSGYIKMSRNKNNQCGIATKASYPLV